MTYALILIIFNVHGVSQQNVAFSSLDLCLKASAEIKNSMSSFEATRAVTVCSKVIDKEKGSK